MPATIVERILGRVSKASDEVDRLRESSPLLEEHREEVKQRMAEEGDGGCCGAFVAARSIREDNQEYR